MLGALGVSLSVARQVCYHGALGYAEVSGPHSVVPPPWWAGACLSPPPSQRPSPVPCSLRCQLALQRPWDFSCGGVGMPEALLSVVNQDGSRLFGKLPKATSSPTMPQLCERIRALPGVSHAYAVMLRGRDRDDMLVGFTYAGYDFSVRVRDGEYWFLLSQADCPDASLGHILAHCRAKPAGALPEPAQRTSDRRQGTQSGTGARPRRRRANPPRQQEHPR